MTQPKKSPGKKFRGAAGEGARAGAPVSKRLGIYGTGDVWERALQRIGGRGRAPSDTAEAQTGQAEFFQAAARMGEGPRQGPIRRGGAARVGMGRKSNVSLRGNAVLA